MATSQKHSIGTAVQITAKLSSYSPVSNQAVTGVDAVRVHDIGQGDCSGLEFNKSVFLYVDYGGVLDHPDPTSAGVKNRMPVSTDTTIVLTHWDWDHYNSARYNTDAQSQPRWLVPRQLVGPRALAFANSLAHAECWPESVGRKPYRFAIGVNYEIEIVKCGPSPKSPGQKEDRNRTGLAVRVIETDDQGADARYVLLPGDAPYNKIPGIAGHAGTCLGFLAYHHGSHNHWTKATGSDLPTKGSSAQKLFYSYGQRNSYGHPDDKKYQPSSWDSIATRTPNLRGKKDFKSIHFKQAPASATVHATTAKGQSTQSLRAKPRVPEVTPAEVLKSLETLESAGIVEIEWKDCGDGETEIVIDGWHLPVRFR